MERDMDNEMESGFICGSFLSMMEVYRVQQIIACHNRE